MPRVSVIIPTYNRSRSIESAIQSVLVQTYQDLEVIVVDDGSTDETRDLIFALMKEDQRIQYLKHDTNRGAQAARNTGIRAAQGDWIAFLDSDDRWLPYSLESRLAAADREGVQVVHSECYVIQEDGNLKLFGVPPLMGWIYHQVLAHPGPVFPALLVTKEAIEKIGYLDERIRSWQEWDTTIRLAKHYSFGFVPEPTFVYDCRGADTISKKTLRDAQGYEQIVHKHVLAILLHVGPRGLADHYRFIASRYRMAGEQRAARRCDVLALLWWPFRLRTIFHHLRQRISLLK